MLRIISKHLTKSAQSFLEEVEDIDWGDEGHGEPGVIDETNYKDFLADEKEKEQAEGFEEREVTPTPGTTVTPEEIVSPERAQTVAYDWEEGVTSRDLVYDGIDNGEIIQFDYTNRHGMFSGTRTVEPHYTFVATTTGNEVLVTFDRSVGDIRAFIVGNIHPDGVRYEGETFDPRPEIMRGVY